jgi:predicted RNA-binding Zn-ribbon protein involved in translation (DUF1610 family)
MLNILDAGHPVPVQSAVPATYIPVTDALGVKPSKATRDMTSDSTRDFVGDGAPRSTPPNATTGFEPCQDVSFAVHCPNCGGFAERSHRQSEHITRTQCNHCDYLMVTCSLTQRVIEAYAPGLSFHRR